MLGLASQAIIVGFNTEPGQGAMALANQEGVEIRRLQHHLQPVGRRGTRPHRIARTRLSGRYRRARHQSGQTFGVGRRLKVAGFYVNDGQIQRKLDHTCACAAARSYVLRTRYRQPQALQRRRARSQRRLRRWSSPLTASTTSRKATSWRRTAPSASASPTCPLLGKVPSPFGRGLEPAPAKAGGEGISLPLPSRYSQ